MRTKLLILGSGPAGLTAAIYAARAGLKPVVVQGLQPGGQMTITTDVENYPGFADVIQGPWLMEQMQKQAAHVGAEFIADLIVDVDLTSKPITLKGDSGEVYETDALIISTGAQAKWLGLPSEKKFQGFGVSACATCDGFFYRGKDVVVVGGGNTAVEEALYLSGLAKSVTIVHRRDHFRAEKILQDRLFAKPNVEVVWDHQVDEILGSDDPPGVTAVQLAANGSPARAAVTNAPAWNRPSPTAGVNVPSGKKPRAWPEAARRSTRRVSVAPACRLNRSTNSDPSRRSNRLASGTRTISFLMTNANRGGSAACITTPSR